MDKYVLQTLIETYKDQNFTRNDESIHVSDMLDGFCPRKFALCKKHKISFRPEQYIKTGRALTFEIGHALQQIIIKKYKKAGVLIGTWKCLGCGNNYYGFYKTCSSCKRKDLFVYKDTQFILNEYGIPIIGNIDLQITWTNKKVIILDIKSIKPESYDTLTSPSRNYSLQMSLYLWLLKKKADIKYFVPDENLTKLKFIINKGIILYVCKTEKPMPFKTFITQFDQKAIIEIENKLEKIKKFMENNKLPKAICNSKDNLMARGCHIKSLCFNQNK